MLVHSYLYCVEVCENMCECTEYCAIYYCYLCFKVFQQVTDGMKEGGFTADGVSLRRKYNRLLARYKQCKDHNNLSGKGTYLTTITATF